VGHSLRIVLNFDEGVRSREATGRKYRGKYKTKRKMDAIMPKTRTRRERTKRLFVRVELRR
jgi:hypothetical protein